MSTVTSVPDALNNVCVWSKRSVRRTMSSFVITLTLEVISKFWGAESWSKQCKERICWTKINAFPVWVDFMPCKTSSEYFYNFVISCQCKFMSRMVSFLICRSFSASYFILSLFSLFCFSAIASWEYLKIAEFYFDGP